MGRPSKTQVSNDFSSEEEEEDASAAASHQIVDDEEELEAVARSASSDDDDNSPDEAAEDDDEDKQVKPYLTISYFHLCFSDFASCTAFFTFSFAIVFVRCVLMFSFATCLDFS